MKTIHTCITCGKPSTILVSRPLVEVAIMGGPATYHVCKQHLPEGVKVSG